MSINLLMKAVKMMMLLLHWLMLSWQKTKELRMRGELNQKLIGGII